MKHKNDYHITSMNPNLKKLTLKLLALGCVFGIVGCGSKQKEYNPSKEPEEVTLQVEENNNTTNRTEEEKIQESLAQYVGIGESENPLKLLIVRNSSFDSLHFGYFRREKEIDEEKKTIYKAYFDDVLTGDVIDLGKREQENENIHYYYQLASRYLSSSIIDDKIEKEVLQDFIKENQWDMVRAQENFNVFANYDVYPITASDIAYNVVAGSLYSNEIEEGRKTR